MAKRTNRQHHILSFNQIPEQRSPETIAQDVDLVRRCLNGDQTAWRTLHYRYHHDLLGVIIRNITPTTRDRAHIEDIGADFWCSLVAENSRRLRAYDPRRTRLEIFLAVVARHQAQDASRAEARRRRLLASWPDSEPCETPISPLETGLWWEDFRQTLSEQEERFVRGCLDEADQELEPVALSPRERKVKQRALAKLRAFLRGD